MKTSQSSASEGVIVFILGMITGMLFAFVLVEHGNREARKASDMMSKSAKPNEPPPERFSGETVIPGKARRN